MDQVLPVSSREEPIAKKPTAEEMLQEICSKDLGIRRREEIFTALASDRDFATEVISEAIQEWQKPEISSEYKGRIETFLLPIWPAIVEKLNEPQKSDLDKCVSDIKAKQTAQKHIPKKQGPFSSVRKFLHSLRWKKEKSKDERPPKITDILKGFSKKEIRALDTEDDAVVARAWMNKVANRIFLSNRRKIHQLESITRQKNVSLGQRVVIFGELVNQCQTNEKLKKILSSRPELLESFKSEFFYLVPLLVEKGTPNAIVDFLAQLRRIAGENKDYDKAKQLLISRLVGQMNECKTPQEIADMLQLLDGVVGHQDLVENKKFKEALTGLVDRLAYRVEVVTGKETGKEIAALKAQWDRAQRTTMYLYAQRINRKTEGGKKETVPGTSGITVAEREMIVDKTKYGEVVPQTALEIARRSLQSIEKDVLPGKPIDAELVYALFDYLGEIGKKNPSDEQKKELNRLIGALDALTPDEKNPSDIV